MNQHEIDEEAIVYDDPHHRTEHLPEKRDRPPDQQKLSNTLEPITNAGGLRLHLLRRQTRYISYALALLQGDFLEDIAVPPPNVPRVARIPPSELLANAVAHACPRGMIKLFMVVFTQPKTTGGDRLIGHPAELNAAFKPPPFQLMTLTSMLAHLMDVGRQSGTLCFIEADFKNFFPQIALGSKLRNYMGIATADPSLRRTEYLVQRVLTQGWNASTFIAQSIAWTIIEHQNPDDEDLCLVAGQEDVPPAYKFARHPLGLALIIIVYDNILIAASSPALAKLWETRLDRNTKYFNAVLKYSKASTDECTFCGIDLQWRNNNLSWRTTTATFERWQRKDVTNRSARTATSLLGAILRQYYVRNTLPLERRVPTQILRSILISMTNAEPPAWNKKNHITTETANTLLQLRDSMSNSWCTLQQPTDDPLIIVTDATPTRTCFLIFTIRDETMTEMQKESHAIPEDDIAVTEALAVLQAILVLPKYERLTSAIIVTDNTTAGRSLSKGYSLHSEVDVVTQKILEAAEARNVHIRTVIDILSQENVADVGTRHQNWESEDAMTRLRHTLRRIHECLPLYKLGAKWIDRRDKSRTTTEGP
ncbi:unnamed protein product [Bodo saltans]|uniref:Reverse transcriptase domain-containing protein n=1 Tax=Bodo saltans TaxID=75058 RepID=A0A0S4IM53_BODSA|nr:unnamed protein product [Bodo saltans]|eukprot:CUE71771.1 unnamed protein product [Bodo saltans]